MSFEIINEIKRKNIQMINIPDQTFESKRDFELFTKTNDEALIVIIEANWSGNCQIMIPVIEKLAIQFINSIKFITIKSEDSEKLELDFNSDVLPKIFFFHKGKIIDKVFGTASFEFLEEKMKTLLEASYKNNMLNIN
jgi:thiol-disulfide isomerase/thioredoxin